MMSLPTRAVGKQTRLVKRANDTVECASDTVGAGHQPMTNELCRSATAAAMDGGSMAICAAPECR